MTPYIPKINKMFLKQMHRCIAIVVLTAFVITSIKVPAYAQASSMPFLAQPGIMVHLSPAFTPAHLKGLVIHPENPFKFDFIISRGDEVLNDSQKHDTYEKLIKYFLASLAIPDEDQWVNLSPYEKDRIIKPDFGKTEMGRDLLSQDYMLKQVTASLIYPEDNLGKKFWDRIYTQAREKFGTSSIPVNTFNKVWIIPDHADVYEHGNMVYVISQHLKVMLEEDYLSLRKHNVEMPFMASHNKDAINLVSTKNDINSLGSQVVREILLPALEKEVNEGKNFAMLRQVYSGMILAAWYKFTLKESFLGKLYANKAKIKGIDQNPKNNEYIYKQYLRAFKKGVFNYIKEDVDKYTSETIPRKYFSGGMKDPGMRGYFDPKRGIVNLVNSAMRYERPGLVANTDFVSTLMHGPATIPAVVARSSNLGISEDPAMSESAKRIAEIEYLLTRRETSIIFGQENFEHLKAGIILARKTKPRIRIRTLDAYIQLIKKTINPVKQSADFLKRFLNPIDGKYNPSVFNEIYEMSKDRNYKPTDPLVIKVLTKKENKFLFDVFEKKEKDWHYQLSLSVRIVMLYYTQVFDDQRQVTYLDPAMRTPQQGASAAGSSLSSKDAATVTHQGIINQQELDAEDILSGEQLGLQDLSRIVSDSAIGYGLTAKNRDDNPNWNLAIETDVLRQIQEQILTKTEFPKNAQRGFIGYMFTEFKPMGRMSQFTASFTRNKSYLFHIIIKPHSVFNKKPIIISFLVNDKAALEEKIDLNRNSILYFLKQFPAFYKAYVQDQMNVALPGLRGARGLYSPVLLMEKKSGDSIEGVAVVQPLNLQGLVDNDNIRIAQLNDGISQKVRDKMNVLFENNTTSQAVADHVLEQRIDNDLLLFTQAELIEAASYTERVFKDAEFAKRFGTNDQGRIKLTYFIGQFLDHRVRIIADYLINLFRTTSQTVSLDGIILSQLARLSVPEIKELLKMIDHEIIRGESKPEIKGRLELELVPKLEAAISRAMLAPADERVVKASLVKLDALRDFESLRKVKFTSQDKDTAYRGAVTAVFEPSTGEILRVEDSSATPAFDDLTRVLIHVNKDWSLRLDLQFADNHVHLREAIARYNQQILAGRQLAIRSISGEQKAFVEAMVLWMKSESEGDTGRKNILQKLARGALTNTNLNYNSSTLDYYRKAKEVYDRSTVEARESTPFMKAWLQLKKRKELREGQEIEVILKEEEFIHNPNMDHNLRIEARIISAPRAVSSGFVPSSTNLPVTILLTSFLMFAHLKSLLAGNVNFKFEQYHPGVVAIAAGHVTHVNPVGGIDFNAANLNLRIKRDGHGMPLPISQQDVESIHIDGLIPVILEIKPAMNNPLLSELQSSPNPQLAKT